MAAASSTGCYLRRRKVFQVTSIYIVAAWGLALGVSELSQTFEVDQVYVRGFVIALGALLPVVAALAWYFDITPEGIVRDRHPVVGLSPSSANSTVQVSWDSANGPETQFFDTSFTLGRDSRCEVNTLDPVASRQHAQIEYKDDVWWLVDLTSSNGTFLNGERVTRARLAGDAEVRLGEGGQVLAIRIIDSSATTMLEPMATTRVTTPD